MGWPVIPAERREAREPGPMSPGVAGYTTHKINFDAGVRGPRLRAIALRRAKARIDSLARVVRDDSPMASIRGAGAQLLDLLVGRQHRGAVDILEVRHGAAAVLQRDLADECAHGGLVVAGAVDERGHGAVDLEISEGGGELLGVGRAR